MRKQFFPAIIANSSKKCIPVHLPIPSTLQKNEVLVQVHAAGVNRPDIMQRKGMYPPPPGAVDTLGLEVSGEVVDVGQGSNQQIGNRVCALVTGGGYAEYCVVDQDMCIQVPNNMSHETMSCFPETAYTVWQNLFSSLEEAGSVRLSSGESLLVHGGTSGIGTMAIQLAKARGCTVIATAGTKEKVNECINTFGADYAYNYHSNWFEDMKKDIKEVDVVLDMVGGHYMQHNINILGTRGRLRIIGFMNSPITKHVNMMRVLLKQINISGSVLRSRPIELKRLLTSEIIQEVLPLVERGLVVPHLHHIFDASTFLEDGDQMASIANEAHDMMEDSKHIGKISMKYR